MARLKPTSEHRPESGKTTGENPRASERDLREAHTQVARSEERWRSIFENSVIGVALTDLNGQFLATNPAYQKMLGYTDEELQRFRCLDITVEEYREHNWALVEELLGGKRRQFQIEKRYRRKDGSLVWVRSSECIVPGTENVPRLIMALSEDITEHKKAKEALQASEVKLRQVIDTIPALAWCNLPDGPNEFFNKRWHDYTGLSPEESNIWGWQVAIHPEDLPPLMKKWQKILASGEPEEIEARIRRHDGEYRWFLSRAAPFRDESGQIVRWYGTSTDIDDRKRAEQHWQRSEAFLADGQHLSKTGTFSWSIETNEVAWSEEMYSIFDFEPGLPVTLEMIGNRVHVEDLPMLEDMIARAQRGESQFEYEHRIVMPDGSIKYIHLVGHTIPETEGRLEYIGAAQDVTQRRVAEEQLRERERNLSLIVDSMPGQIVRMSASGEVELVNRQLLAFFGKKLEDIKSWSTSGIVHSEDLPRAIEVASKSFATGEPYEMEIRVRRFDGVYRWIQARGIPLRDAEGRVLQWYALHTDIDDLKKAEEALQSNERNLSLIINTIPTLAWSALPDGSAEFFNQHYLDYVGLPSEKLRGWGWAIAVHPEDLSALSGVWQSIMAAGRLGEAEARLRRFDGQYRWFLFRANPMRDESGEIVKWYGTNTDIDDRKRAEEALQSNERNLSLMINAIPTFIQVSRADGTVLTVNQTVLDYHGVSIADVQREDFRSRFYHPDDAKRLRDQREEALKRPVPFEYEQRARGKDGAYRWFLVRYNPLFDDQGKIDRWYAAAFDINDRKRAEAEVKESYLRLAEAQQLSKTGSFITDLVADDHNWSEETFRIFEFDSAAKVTVQMIRDQVHPEDLPPFDAMIARAMTGKDVDFAFRFVTSRGAVKHIRGMARVIEHIAGRPLFIGALQDVSDTKIAEEALSRARSELAHVARVTTLNALTASIAHEINQPLSGIITNANTSLWLLTTDPPDLDGAREAAQRTIRDGERASDVIKRLRTLYSKKESQPESVDLNEATREVISLSLSDLQRNRLIVRDELGDDLPLITGDRIQLQQVILNLLRNASDAMSTIDDRPRDLLIKTEREVDNCVRLSVKDVGVGFEPQIAEKLFEAFYSTKRDGLGIGLHVSRSIIEAHRGRLWATANDGPGATFSFAIPCSLTGTRLNRSDDATIQE